MASTIPSLSESLSKKSFTKSPSVSRIAKFEVVKLAATAVGIPFAFTSFKSKTPFPGCPFPSESSVPPASM